MAKANISILFPCAGYGRRMGSPPAKELLPHPRTGKPMIETAMEPFAGFRRVIATRPDKKELIAWCALRNIETLLIPETREWPDSVLASREVWSEKNLLVLPDTDYQPREIPFQLLESLDRVEVAFATFNPPDLQNWGLIEKSENGFLISDKPCELRDCGIGKDDDLGTRAWGLIAFRKEIGVSLFSKISEANRDKQWKTISEPCELHSLQDFSDMTRAPSLDFRQQVMGKPQTPENGNHELHNRDHQ